MKKVLSCRGKNKLESSASKQVSWCYRHRLVLGRDGFQFITVQKKEYYFPEPPKDSEDPQWLKMIQEDPSEEFGDGPHSSEECDPENYANRKRNHLQKK